MDIEVVDQKPVALAEVEILLENLKSSTKELGFRAEKVRNYVLENNTTKKADADELYKKINELNIPRLRDKLIIKIVDIMPEDIDGLKAIFAGETISLKQDELNKILEVIK